MATAEGTPGPSDPRAWARLMSAAWLGRLLSEATHPREGSTLEPGMVESLARKLKELSLFDGPAALCILTWEDLGASLALASADAGHDALPGEATDASPVGLTAITVPAADAGRKWLVRWKSDPPGRDVAVTLWTLVWDGKTFDVKMRPGTVPAKEKELALP